MSTTSLDNQDENQVIIQKKSNSCSRELEPTKLDLTNRWLYGTIAIKIILIYIYIFIIDLPLYVDEQIHVPQAQKFCNSTYDYDPNISTTPGLYYFAKLLPICNLLSLRLFNSSLSILNHWLLYKIKLQLNDNNEKNAALWALSISLSAPILFFDHLFYTETLSLCFVLAMILLKEEDPFIAAIFASFALFVRQDNIFWIGYLVLRHVYEFTFSDQNRLDIFRNKLLPYAIPCGSFILFVYWNHYSIALGAQHAHKPCFHHLQIAYFAEFVLIIAPGLIFSFQKQPISNLKSRFIQITLPIIFAFITYSLIQWPLYDHPYLLNDNRHFTFYLWNRFGQFQTNSIRNLTISSIVHCTAISLVFLQITGKQCNLIAFGLCTSISLVIHQLLDVRYFFVPFILLKLTIEECNRQLWIDIISNCFLNGVTFYCLRTYEVKWPDFDYVQRIGW